MKKERVASFGSHSDADNEPKLTRTTVFLTDIQDHNLDLLALQTGKPKGELIREGISQVLEKYHYRSDQKASFNVSFDSGRPRTAAAGRS